MPKHTQFKVGGVPEHFNLPWKKAIEENRFAAHAIDISWKDYCGGTGAMTKALREGELDIAILLTEGMIADIHRGNQSKIVQFYVKSPLRWGIHVGAQSKFKTVADLENTKAAISRYGSGSHLMAYVNADNHNWNLDKQKFEVVKSLDGGREFLTKGEADYFLWEKFTTKPFVDNGEFRIVGECPTPWPSFVVAVRQDLLVTHYNEIEQVLNIVNDSCKEVKANQNSIEEISERYQLKKEDVAIWFNETEWACNGIVDAETIDQVQERLMSLEIIGAKMDFDLLCSPFDEKLKAKVTKS
ncbi:MAG: substrate-binding domain-containing protein [Flavobacteriales bacterium]|nr:substrate-binding domain-containing protein [Flavobacteriales bacterium]